MILTTRRLAIVLAMCLCAAGPAMAQNEPLARPPLDVAVGLAYMHEGWLERDLKFGWVLSVQRHLNERFAIVAEGGGSYGREEPFPAFIPYSMWTHSVLAGPRGAATLKKVVVYGQLLTGWVRRTRTNPGSVVTPANEGEVNTLGLQPGGGVEYRLNRRTALRFQGDFRRLSKTDAIPRTTTETRFMAGFVFGAERQP